MTHWSVVGVTCDGKGEPHLYSTRNHLYVTVLRGTVAVWPIKVTGLWGTASPKVYGVEDPYHCSRPEGGRTTLCVRGVQTTHPTPLVR